MTYGELFNLFKSKNPKLVHFIEDYRPEEFMSLIIWFNNGMSIITKYNDEKDVFELKEG